MTSVMGPFAIPLPAWRFGQHRQRRKSRRQEGDNEDQPGSASPTYETESRTNSSQPASGSINPRSHSPNTLRQFAVAGQSPEEEVPSEIYQKFPHKGLPPGYPSAAGDDARSRARRGRKSTMMSGSEADVDTDASEGGHPQRADRDEMMVNARRSARLKHINTMMAILHRCLHDGDIPRAKRAFGVLLRIQDVDIRLNGMWSIGVEILMRDGEGKGQEQAPPDHAAEGRTANAARAAPGRSELLPRWGSAANMDSVRDYLENLIQQHPYDPHRPHLTSAFDFWPALFSIEIYNVDAEFRRALHRSDQISATSPDNGSEPLLLQRSGSEDYGSPSYHRREGSDPMAIRWTARDEIREEVQIAAQQISTRMDQLMENLPYTTHLELLRLRGLLALFIGDLYPPSWLMEQHGLEDDLRGLSLREGLRREVRSERDIEALRRREEEQAKARHFFERIRERGGELEPSLVEFLNANNDDGGDADGDHGMADLSLLLE